MDEMAAIASSLQWEGGTIKLRGNLAELNLSPDFRFLNAGDARKVLVDLWGNPPPGGVLGMIFPADVDPLGGGSWGVVVEYEEGGYIRDGDNDKINYDQLLKEMQAQALKSNDERTQHGYPTIELVGWATPPHYDKEAHKLYWAKDLRFGGGSRDTLNYGIRILGRRGVLLLNAVARMDQLDIVEEKMTGLLPMINFQPGNLYADFDPKIDKVATYGLATLIAGGALGAAAKLGLLKFLWVGLLALKKFIVLGVVAAGTFLRRLMSRRKRTAALPPPSPVLPPDQGGTPPVSS